MIELNDEQKGVQKHILSGGSCVVLGSAGSGKTTLLQQTLPKLRGVVVAASTAAAAANIGFGAITLHFLFGLKPNLYTPLDRFKSVPKKVLPLLKRMKVLVIEEISMCRIDVLEKADYMLRQVHECDVPFGGICVIMLGDVMQLPPVVAANEKTLFHQHYKSPWFFTSDSVKDIPVYTLSQVHRQRDPRQQRILQSIRNRDKFVERAVEVLNAEAISYSPEEQIPTICAYNADVDKINQHWYVKNPNKEVVYVAECDGLPKDEKYFPVPKQIKLKVGCLVRVCANAANGSYHNGMVGTVKHLGDDAVLLDVGGNEVVVGPAKFEVVNYKARGSGIMRSVVAERVQIPLKLAFAISVHSAQGLTVDRLNVHLGKSAFAPNLAYVALSRVRDLSKMSFVRPLKISDVVVDCVALNYYNQILNQRG